MPGGYSTLSWVRMCGPKFRPPPYNKTREDANLLPISKPLVSWRALFKTNQCFLQCKLGCISTFWQPIDKPKDKFIRNYAFWKKRDLYLNQFSNKKGANAKPESPKKHPIWAAHPRTHLSTKYPPGQECCSTIHSDTVHCYTWAGSGICTGDCIVFYVARNATVQYAYLLHLGRLWYWHWWMHCSRCS